MSLLSIILWVLCLGYVGHGLYKIYQNNKGQDASNDIIGNLWDDIVNADIWSFLSGLKHFIFFLIIFKLIVVSQGVAQTCDFKDEKGLMSILNTGFSVEEFERVHGLTYNLNEIEKGRSHNYYRRYFNIHGGRPSYITLQCSWNLKEFKNNIFRDIEDRNKWV